MVVNHKVTGKASSVPAGLALGGAVSLAMTLTLAALIARLVSTEVLPEEKIGYGVMGLLFISAFGGALMANNRIKRQKLLVSALAGGVYWAMLLSITALFFGGQYEAVGVTALVVMGGSLVTAFLGQRPGRGGKHRKPKTHHR